VTFARDSLALLDVIDLDAVVTILALHRHALMAASFDFIIHALALEI
jgi:hypothetical protein